MLYGAIASALVADLSESAVIYRNDPDLYGLMLSLVYDKAYALDWNIAADRYKMLYEIAQRPN